MVLLQGLINLFGITKVLIQLCFTLFSDAKEMASSSSNMGDNLDALTCSVCLAAYDEPVGLPCGHSFCRVCIETYWASKEEDTACVCPICREVFPQKPKLKKNVTIAYLMENIVNVKKGGPGGTDSHCEVCKREAAKMCVPCEILCCEKHLKPHQQKGHKLVDLVVKIEELRCTKHGKPIQLYCKDDESLMCVTCMGGQHRDHDVVDVEIAHSELKGALAAKYPHVSQSMERVASQLQQVQEEKEQTERSSRDAEDSLEEKRRLVCQFVNESVDLMKSEINKRKMEKLSLLGKQREKLEQQMASLRQGKSTMDKALQKLEAVSFLQSGLDNFYREEEGLVMVVLFVGAGSRFVLAGLELRGGRLAACFTAQCAHVADSAILGHFDMQSFRRPTLPVNDHQASKSPC
uniref:E3 ubiquitin-protein ligase TRIM8-like isoform X3 n=1 Tax=Myxine glutinosa TaxID=7769 RepID=UPI00358F502E